MTRLRLESWATQQPRWPTTGRHILASFDDDTIVLYQAYKPSIAAWAVAHQKLGGPDFSMSRMSWVKPNFLWMMHRSSWATSPGQERILALHVARADFIAWLGAAVTSSYTPRDDEDRATWKVRLDAASAIVQWDPDHDPTGRPLERRAVQLGLRGPLLQALATTSLRRVDDVTDVAVVGRAHRTPPFDDLMLPAEYVLPLGD